MALPAPQLVRFRPRAPDAGPPGYGLLAQGRVRPVPDPFAPGDAVAALASAPDPAPGALPLDEVELLCPVRPTKILCVGVNYVAHAAELQKQVPEEPMLFFKPPSALVGPGAPIRLWPGVGRIDYEGEVVLVLGRRLAARPGGASREEARAALLGVTCGNDVSARVLQKKDGQWARAKGFDTFAPVGPAITFGLDPLDLEIRTRVNGEERQHARTSEMAFDPLRVLGFISSVMTLEPGDVVFTGTPSGVGELHPGDRVEVEVEGVGVLENPVVQ